MSDHITFEIQVEIIKRLPINSLIRFRSVSKPWKSLIDSAAFIADYNFHHSQQQRLLVSYRDPADSELKYFLIDDDSTFPQRKCSLNVPKFFKLIKKPEIIGSSHGLLCLNGYHHDRYGSFPNPGSGIVVLWNPVIRKSVVIIVPNELRSPYETVTGFGVCPNKNDPKLVKINYIGILCSDWESISCIPFQVEVFTLSSGVWRIPSGNFPRKSVHFQCSNIVIDGFIYWIAADRANVDSFKSYKLIISFDLTTEEFKEISLPEYLALQHPGSLSISKLRDSLIVLECSRIDVNENSVYGVWMMEHGVPNSFKKLFTVDVPNAWLNSLLGFRENGEPILEMVKDFAVIDVYEPSSKQIKGLGIYGEVHSFFVSSYMQTLMLFDQPDSIKVF